MDVEARDERERRAEDRAHPDVHRPDRQADGSATDQERDGDEAGPEADAAGSTRGAASTLPAATAISRCCAIFATARANSDDPRPPARCDVVADADDGWCCTAAILLQPGRAATVAASAAALRVGEDDDLSGSLDDVLARELRIAALALVSAPSAMSVKPNSL